MRATVDRCAARQERDPHPPASPTVCALARRRQRANGLSSAIRRNRADEVGNRGGRLVDRADIDNDMIGTKRVGEP